MTRNYRVVLLLVFVCFMVCGLTFGQNVDYRLISDKLALAGNLEILWQNKLPIRKSETLKQMDLLDGHLYALSSGNYLVSLDGTSGSQVFATQYAEPGLPVGRMKLYSGQIYSMAGSRLKQLNPNTGQEISSKEMGFSVSCDVARNSGYCYFGTVEGLLKVFRQKDYVKLFEVSAASEASITSIIADENFVVFSTSAGDVVSIRPEMRGKFWQFNAADAVVGPTVQDDNSLFLASKDTNVYRIDIATGKLVWNYKAGGVLDVSPVVTEKTVYQNVGVRGLAAIDKKTGKFIWQLPQGVSLLAEHNDRAYVMTNIGKLVVMNNKTAKKIYSINFSNVTKWAANTKSDLIYIGDNQGRIACLKPVE